MLTDKNRPNPPYFIVNTGGIRYDIFKGPFTLSTSYQITPFENPYYYIEDVPTDVAEKIIPAMNKQGEMRKRDFVLDDRNEKCGSKVNPWQQKRSLTPGYVTKDDLGTDGKEISSQDNFFLLTIIPPLKKAMTYSI